MTSGRKAQPTANFLCDLGPLLCCGRAMVSASICNVPGIGLTFISTDSHPSGLHSSLSQVGKALLSHFIVRETEPKRLSDLLKATQLADDGRNWEALWTGRPAWFSLHTVGDPPAEATPQVSPLLPVWALRLRRPVESHQVTQSLVSLGLTLLTA